MGKQKILVVDDEPIILKIVEAALQKEGYEIYTAMDGKAGVDQALKIKPDLIIMDVMMPVMDGLEACQRIKIQMDVPIVMLTAKTSEVDKIVGFKMGVDDYQTKPFSPAELSLRVKAILRRTSGNSNDKENSHSFTYPNLEIHKQTRQVKVFGNDVELTAKEFDLLWCLVSSPNQVFSRMQLLERIWDSTYPGDENTVTVHIRRLREKIEPTPAEPTFIKTVWGVGYKFELTS